MQTGSVHMMYFLDILYKDAPLPKNCLPILLPRWSEKKRSRFYSKDVDTYMALGASAQGIKEGLNNSTF